MSPNENLQLMARYNNLWSLSSINQADQVLDDKFARWGSSGNFKGIPAFKRYVISFLAAFPDIRFIVDDCLATTDKVTLRYRFTATHRGAFMGVPPTARKVEAKGIAIYRIVDGRLVELWDYLDMWGILAQLGKTPFDLQME